MNFACFVSFMTFQFFLNLAFHANICPIRTLMRVAGQACLRQVRPLGGPWADVFLRQRIVLNLLWRN